MKKGASLALILTVLLLLSSCASQGEIKGAGREDVIGNEVLPDVLDSTESVTPDPEPVYKKLTFAAVGDNIIYQAGFTDAKNRSDGSRPYNFLPNYENIADVIASADISFINQETLMAGEAYGYSDYPHFNSPQSLADDLITVGFDVISMANNHMLDMGTNGLGDTISYYKTLSDRVTMIGGYENEEDFNTPRIIERDGIKIAFVAFTYATNGLVLSSNSDIYVPYIDDDAVESSILAAKEEADLVFVSMHWGDENSFVPNSEQKYIAQLAADCGADVIIGHHPHVIQPVEWLEGRDGNRTLCIYSLGDLIAVMTRASNMLGGLVTFDIVQENDEFRIENPIFNPTVFHFGPSYYNGKIYFLSDFTSELAATFGNVYGITADYDDLAAIVKDTIDDEFLPEYLKTNE
ncbi:MAG: CapA family protein [Clostridia bacterium]|nr:CapA family protein [Clostridia bacterium]